MIDLDQIADYYPPALAESAVFRKHILKEYVQLLTLDYLSATEHVRHVSFIGGTNLRLVMGIDRFSEDLDFDCKDFAEDQFIAMSNDVVTFLQRSGFNVECRDRTTDHLNAFSRRLYFPELLFDLGLTGYRNARFMLKLEAQDQEIAYEAVYELITGCGLIFPFPVPSEAVLCSMKIAAMLNRGKGRDYYDVMFLLSRTEPDYDFLAARSGIHNRSELKAAVAKSLETVDLTHKQRDFEHLLFNRAHSRRIQQFPTFIESL